MFWLLGAYEVVRPMVHTSGCFEGHYVDLLKSLRKRLESVGMPAAKMEPRRKSVPVISGRSPAEINQEERDLLIGDPDGQLDSCRDLIRTFNEVTARLTHLRFCNGMKSLRDGRKMPNEQE